MSIEIFFYIYRLLNGLPNTYAYSKALTEGLITSYGAKIPIVVCRPSIGISASIIT